MTRINLLILFFAVLLIAAYSSWLLSTFKSVTQTESDAKRHVADYFLEDISATLMDAKGKPRYRLTATRLDHYADNDTIEITKPVLNVLRDNQLEWNIISDTGVILKQGEEILLNGDVTIKQDARAKQPATVLHTRNLRIQLPDEFAATNENVVIHHGLHRLSGTGMNLYLAGNRLELLAKGKGTYVVSP
jgi:lipopolysaccharide export system protein LptC